MKIIFGIIEIFSLIACAIFGYMWTQDPNGNYEPWLFLAGLIFIAFEMFRRYEKELFSKDGKISSIIPWFRHWLSRPIIVRHQRDNWWHMGATGNKEPSMQVVSYWYITNQTNRPVRILNAYIVKPRVYGHVMTKDVGSQYHGSYPVPPNTTTDLHADFWINPPIRRIGKDLLVDIVFVDQYGQKRKIRNVEFPSDKKKAPQPKSLQVEAIYALENDIEKKVAAVLKDEINRYKKFGRNSGELGSIYAVCSRGKIKSIYQDSWTDSKSGERQEIITDPENSCIRSENGDALVNYYNELQNESDRDLFLNSLISRINRNKEYYCVSYLILYVLFRVGHLKDGLAALELSLQLQPSLLDRILHRKPKEELLELHQRYGYSDALGLINGLLRYEHPSFTYNELDLIEQFISNVDEYAFKIDEKINSIRSYRLTSEK
ncbi:MAG: hypothetical protein OEU95_03745 [Nitrospirota bacterium]|nr:hypothetical protein [Nitrospirota bacterium]